MKYYYGNKHDTPSGPVEVFIQYDKPEEGSTMLLGLGPSLAIRNHSPDGFSWGYSGSGPIQLALAILLDHLGHKVGGRALAAKLYQSFKRKFIAPAGDILEISDRQIDDWVRAEKKKERELVQS